MSTYVNLNQVSRLPFCLFKKDSSLKLSEKGMLALVLVEMISIFKPAVANKLGHVRFEFFFKSQRLNLKRKSYYHNLIWVTFLLIYVFIYGAHDLTGKTIYIKLFPQIRILFSRKSFSCHELIICSHTIVIRSPRNNHLFERKSI